MFKQKGDQSLNLNRSHQIDSVDVPWTVKVFEDEESLSEAVVDAIEERLHERLLNPSPKPLGLATGRTMEPIYAGLVNRLGSWPSAELERLLRSWYSFNLDEYVGLPVGDRRSFSSYMAKHLGDPLQLSSLQLRVPDGNAIDPNKEACSYLEHLNSFGGISMQLIGLGTNGHVGFNEPPCGADVSCRVVSLTASTRRQNAYAFGCDPGKVPCSAISLGLKEILEAEEIHLIVTGSAKTNVLNSLLNMPCSEQLPASWLKTHQRLSLWVDQEAMHGPILKGSINNQFSKS